MVKCPPGMKEGFQVPCDFSDTDHSHVVIVHQECRPSLLEMLAAKTANASRGLLMIQGTHQTGPVQVSRGLAGTDEYGNRSGHR